MMLTDSVGQEFEGGTEGWLVSATLFLGLNGKDPMAGCDSKTGAI